MNPTRTRKDGCLADFTLDRRLAGELSEGEEARARAHLDECARCTERHAALLRERDDFATNAPPFVLPRRRASGGRQWLAGGAAALAMAAAVLLLLRGHGAGDGTRTKGGGAQIEVYVNHGGDVRRGVTGEVVAPGDAIRLVVTSPALPYVGVLSLDGAAHASVYYPSSGDVPPIPLGRAFALPESTLLDDVLGKERLFVFLCPHPFATEPLRRAIEAAPDEPPGLPQCDVRTFVLQKERAPSP